MPPGGGGLGGYRHRHSVRRVDREVHEMSNAKTHPGIVVGIERSGACGTVVRWAAREAILRKVALTLVPVHPLPAFGSSARVLATAPTVDELHQWREDEVRRMFSDAIKSIEDD